MAVRTSCGAGIPVYSRREPNRRRGAVLTTPRKRPLRAAVSLVVLVLLAGLVAACGAGGARREDAKTTIDDAFSHSIHSANVTLQLSLKADGVAQLQQPVQVKLS